MTFRPLILLPCLLGPACWGPEIAADWSTTVAAGHSELAQPSRAATSLLDGFDQPTDAGVADGDRALYRVTLLQGKAIEQEWLVRLTIDEAMVRGKDGRPAIYSAGTIKDDDGSDRPLIIPYRIFNPTGGEVVQDFESHVSAVRVEIFDPSAKPRANNLVYVGRKYLEKGFVSACTTGGSKGQPAKGARTRAHHTLLSFLGIVRRDEVLRDVFWQVVRLPSLWSIATNLGVKIRLDPQFHNAERLPGGDTAGLWDLPVRVLGNGQPMLLASLRVATPKSPIAMCAGVISMTAITPGNPERRLRMELIAARRDRR